MKKPSPNYIVITKILEETLFLAFSLLVPSEILRKFKGKSGRDGGSGVE